MRGSFECTWTCMFEWIFYFYFIILLTKKIKKIFKIFISFFIIIFLFDMKLSFHLHYFNPKRPLRSQFFCPPYSDVYVKWNEGIYHRKS